MERNIITMDGQGNITLPTNTGSIAMTEWELCELFGVIAPNNSCRDKGYLQKRSFKGTRDNVHHPSFGQIQRGGLQN